ncbi:PLP-dependent transferase [Haematococcus lacustris]
MQVSHRVLATDAACIDKTKQLTAATPGAVSLAQGIVHWQPPPQALKVAVEKLQSDPQGVSGYGPTQGLPALRDALKAKLRDKNGLHGVEVMVTAGANQAFVNVVLGLCDAGSRVVLFRPYYFNHLMALQMTGGGQSVVFGPSDPHTLHPDLRWLREQLAGPTPPRMVVIVNPSNPTGVLLSAEEVQEAAALCSAAGCWLVLDNTYEDFCYDGLQHTCASGPHIINIFSFSKACGMMGWRVGYLALPDPQGDGDLLHQLLKIQDTIPICATQLSQQLALEALTSGQGYVQDQIRGLEGNRAAILDALSPLGSVGNGIAGGEGSIYLWARLPEGCDDEKAVVWLVRNHGVCVIPGSTCGAPGFVRVSFANLKLDACKQAAERLKAGLSELVALGVDALSGVQGLAETVAKTVEHGTN